MKLKYLGFLLLSLFLLSACSKYDEAGYEKVINKKYVSNQNDDATVKNVILIIGDGLGANHVEVASMILNDFKFDLFNYEYKSMMETSCLNYYVTDSAAAATALATGVKTNKGNIGVDSEGNELKTILDYVHEAGMATGVVTDQDAVDATPAGFTSHSINRYLNTDQMVIQQIDGTLDVIMGLGARRFFEYEDRILENDWNFVMDYASFKKARGNRLLATFSDSDDDIPPLYEMTKKAIDILSKNKNGFFLMVEAGEIDDVCDSGDIEAMADEVSMLDKTLRVALNFMRSNDETIVIVLADHETGGLIIGDGKPNSSWFTEPENYHTPVDVPVYAFGTRSKIFDNKQLSNSDIFGMLLELLNFNKE